MTDADIRRLLFTINSIYPNFKVENPEQMVNIWLEFLGDQNATAIGASLKNYVRNDTSGFAPSIGQLVQGAYEMRNRDELSAGEAWSMVYKALCRSNYYADEEFAKFPDEVKTAVGSPAQLRAWAADPAFNEGVASSNFRRAYETACTRKRHEATMSPDVRAMLETMDLKRIGGMK